MYHGFKRREVNMRQRNNTINKLCVSLKVGTSMFKCNGTHKQKIARRKIRAVYTGKFHANSKQDATCDALQLTEADSQCTMNSDTKNCQNSQLKRAHR
mmetsp:Transcript_26769/g.37751  ORF Transcript_26769/g.37751 Transcript_26769/m.37751 type:complete len:98 (-) Transcript_26769:82-375(-)